MFVIYIFGNLRTVVLFKVLDELLRRVGKLKLLGDSPEILQCFDKLLFCRFLTEFYKYSSRMSIEDRNTHALAGDHRFRCGNDLSVNDLSPESQRLFFALLFLSSDVGDDVVLHLRPVLKGLARA